MKVAIIYKVITTLCLIRISYSSPYHEWKINFPGPVSRPQESDYNEVISDCTTTNGKRGRCETLLDCEAVLSSAFNTTRTSKETINILKEAHCGYKNDDIKVCCLLQSNEGFTNSPQNGKITTESPKEVSVEGLPEECGKKEILTKRMDGSRPAQLRSWPWIALIGYRSRTNPTWACGGSLVTSKHVITAAHCIIGKKLTIVRLGELDWSTSADNDNHVDIPILRGLSHPHYNRKERTSDIGIIILRDEVQFNEDIRPICLPFSDSVKSINLERLSPFIAGWGSSSNRNTMMHLQEAQVDVKPNDECASAFARLEQTTIEKTTIDERVLCAEGSNIETCQGDSGGPLMLPYNRQYYLFGVVAFGNKCAEPGYPGAYVRVTEYLDWIKSNIELDS